MRAELKIIIYWVPKSKENDMVLSVKPMLGSIIVTSVGDFE
jgi:hypothetical protein